MSHSHCMVTVLAGAFVLLGTGWIEDSKAAAPEGSAAGGTLEPVTVDVSATPFMDPRAIPLDTRSPTSPPEHPIPFDIEVTGDDAKYAVRGPFHIGDPVHETMTTLALQDAGFEPAGKDKGLAQQVKRGVFWNDDPCAQLFATNAEDLSKSTGIEWYFDFRTAEQLSKTAGAFASLKCPLLGRSHFGDLQFLHGMASADGIPAAETHALLVGWAELAYRVAIKDIDAMKGVTEAVALLQRPELAARVADISTPLVNLLRTTSRQTAQQRALGSLLHLIQDSYAAGHTERAIAGDRRAGLRRFYSYARQNHGRHREDDQWRGGGTDRERVAQIKGGKEAVEASTEIVRLWQRREPWTKAEQYLRSGPLMLEPNAQPSSPGAGYVKTN